MAYTVVLTAGDSPVDQGLGFSVHGISFSNLTAQWIWFGSMRYAAPNSRGTFYVDGDDYVHYEWKAPPNTTQPPAAASQVAVITFTPVALWDSGTASAPKGLYYDRNPTDVVNQYLSTNLAPHVATTRWTYTVPAGRKAFCEMIQCMVELEAAGDLAPTNNQGFAESYIGVTPSGASLKQMLTAYIQDKAPSRTRADSVAGASINLLPGDLLTGRTANTYTATNATHYVQAKITEYDL